MNPDDLFVWLGSGSETKLEDEPQSTEVGEGAFVAAPDTFVVQPSVGTISSAPFPTPINIMGLFSDAFDTLRPALDSVLRLSQDDDGSTQTATGRALPRLGLVTPMLPPLTVSAQLWEMIDAMKADIAESEGLFSTKNFAVTSAIGLTLTLSAGYVIWLLRLGYLATSLLTLSPLVIQFDPLPILVRRKSDKDSEKDAREHGDDSGTDTMFEKSGSATHSMEA